MPIQIGDIFGDYEVTGVLGRGGMGKVFRVRSLLTEREEAMKVVLPDLDENPALAERFLREIKVHASLQHPNIAALHTALRVEGRLVMIMELVEGVTLEETLQRGPVQVPLAVHYIVQMLAALQFAHERGVIHRDIKPANILIAGGGVVKLTDFGIARSEAGVRLTGTGLAVGTLAFMSPEQVRTGEADARSDIYSLGLTFYEMVTARRPIYGDTELALMNAQLSLVPAEPAAVNPMVPQFVSAAIMRALAKDPALRFQTAREFQAALQPVARPAAPTSVTGGAGSTTAIPAELADLETRLARAIGPIARRLVADAARRYGSMSEIRQVLAAQIEDPKERAVFLKTNPGLTMTVAMPAPTPAPVVIFDPAMLDRMAQVLAPFLGPIAKIMVARAAKSARSAEELQNALASEISSDDERRRFLAAVRTGL